MSWRNIKIEGTCAANNWWDNMDMSVIEGIQDMAKEMPSMDDMKEMWEDMGAKIDMRDGGMSMSMEGMQVEMQEGPDGNSMRIVLGASKLAASAALALGAAALY